jgi:hypothetical protein
MKGFPKPILISIIEHATPDDFGQFLLMSKWVEKVFEKVVKDLKWDMQTYAGFFGSLEYVKYQTHTMCLKAVMKNPFALRYVKDNKTADFIRKYIQAITTFPDNQI